MVEDYERENQSRLNRTKRQARKAVTGAATGAVKGGAKGAARGLPSAFSSVGLSVVAGGAAGVITGSAKGAVSGWRKGKKSRLSSIDGLTQFAARKIIGAVFSIPFWFIISLAMPLISLLLVLGMVILFLVS